MPLNRLLLLNLCCWVCPILLQAQHHSHAGFNFSQSTIDEGNGIIVQTTRMVCEHTRPESRTILLIHGGGPGDRASFDFYWNDNSPFATDLAEMGFTVYLMDVRGWEGSTAPAYSLTDTAVTAGSCQEAAQDIDAVVDYIRKWEQIDRVNLFGWATGGHWASYFTTLHNDKVDNLIVLNTLYGVKAPWALSGAFADPADSNRYNNHLPVYREIRPTIPHRRPAECRSICRQERLDRHLGPAQIRRNGNHGEQTAYPAGAGRLPERKLLHGPWPPVLECTGHHEARAHPPVAI